MLVPTMQKAIHLIKRLLWVKKHCNETFRGGKESELRYSERDRKRAISRIKYLSRLFPRLFSLRLRDSLFTTMDSAHLSSNRLESLALAANPATLTSQGPLSLRELEANVPCLAIWKFSYSSISTKSHSNPLPDHQNRRKILKW